MDEQEQARERRIGALRQVVTLLRGKRDAGSDEARAGWSAELEKMADEEAIGGRTNDTRVAYKSVMAYLRNELGLDRDKVQKMLEEMVQRLISGNIHKTIEREVSALVERYYGTPKLTTLVEAEVKRLVTQAVGPQVTLEVSRIVTRVLNPPPAPPSNGG